MAKKKLAVPKKMTFLEKFNIPRNEEEHVQRLIDVTERAITKQGTAIDQLFIEQAARLRKELADLKRK